MKRLCAALLALPALAASAAVPPPPDLVPPGAEGYWFYLNPPAPLLLPESPILMRPPVPMGKTDPCQQEATWTAQCGFVTPTRFSMQSKERDALLQNMVMNPGDPASVLAVQHYTAWILHQSIYAARVWKYNNLQHPRDLDPAATSPISAFGLRLAMDVQGVNRKTVWSAIRQYGGFLVVFTKDDCDYCHAQTGPLQALASDTGLEVWDASLKGSCLQAFAKFCMDQKTSTMPARILHVSLVPTVMLYLPDNVWIRVSAGLTDAGSMESRIYNLFISWKAAASGVAKQTGRTGLALDPGAAPKDSQELRQLLMTPMTGTGEASMKNLRAKITQMARYKKRTGPLRTQVPRASLSQTPVGWRPVGRSQTWLIPE